MLIITLVSNITLDLVYLKILIVYWNKSHVKYESIMLLLDILKLVLKHW